MLTRCEITDWQELEDTFEERAAINEYDENMTRWEAEQAAAQRLGFDNKSALKQYIQRLKATNGRYYVE